MRELDYLICGDAYTSDAVLRVHRELCLRFGGRFSGSPEGAAAGEFLAHTITGYGLDSIEKEAFPITRWTRGETELTLLSPVVKPLPCLALPYAPACDREFKVVDLGMGHEDDFRRVNRSPVGLAVLVDDANPVSGRQLHRLHKYLAAREAGAGAFVFVQVEPGMLARTGSLAFNHQTRKSEIPAIGVSAETGAELRERLRHGDVCLRLRMAHLLEPAEDHNVIADLHGSGKRSDLIIVGGHFDGHDIAQGAVDNASGTAVIVEIARLLEPLRRHLAGNIRFVLFSGEEMGLIGSHFHAARYSDPGTIRLVCNLDCVAGSRLKFMLQNSQELVAPVQAMVSDLPAEIDVRECLVPFSDHFPFILRGIPGIQVARSGSGGRGWGHTCADTFEKVGLHELQSCAAQVASIILRLDRLSPWPGRYKDPDSVRALLAESGMEPLLRYEGHWPWPD
ncbi:M28 family peptidase [bacterium]|nr:M28 family peptidase [candidate division CSSED10-310 bacterium]